MKPGRRIHPELANLLNNELFRLAPDKCDSTQSISSFLRFIPDKCSTPSDGKGQSLTALKKTPEEDVVYIYKAGKRGKK